MCIQNVHLRGTLIIRGSGGNNVEFDRSSWLEPGPDGYPTLLIDVPNGTVDFLFDSVGIDEAARSVDYNEDGDQLDTFPQSFEGLVWVNAKWVWFYASAWTFQGCLVATEDVWVEDGVTVQNDPALASRLIPGFTDGMLHVERGSIKQGAP
ncbi:MAG: hypothetical protein IID37_14560 [Planctomycetes bacterium]|nr:hypothetical protein [Planctomycetota bacterium]